MSLRPALIPAINYLHSFVSLQMRNRLVLRTSIRCLSNKTYGKSLNTAPIIEEKDLSKERVFLKDENGNFLGEKSLIESRVLAQKRRMNLIEDKEDNHHKYKCFKMVSNKHFFHLEEKEEKSNESNESTGSSSADTRDTKIAKEVKHLVFSTKLSENDLMTKINQIKRWLSRGHQIAINVTNPLSNDKKHLEQIYVKFETELKSFAKFNQKKIKSNNTLKFMILPNLESKDQLKNSTTDTSDTNEDIDIDNMDPNKLLSDEFEKELEKK